MNTKHVFNSECPLGVKVQAWTWRSNLHIVQLIVGKVEVRRWKLGASADALAKFEQVCQMLTDNQTNVIP